MPEIPILTPINRVLQPTSEPYVNPPADDSVTRHIGDAPLPSTEDLPPMPRTVFEMDPRRARQVAQIVQPVMPAVADAIRSQDDGSNEPVILEGMLGMQASQIASSVPEKKLRRTWMGIRKPELSPAEARLDLLRQEISGVLGTEVVQEITNQSEAGNTFDSLGLPVHEADLDVYLTNRAIQRVARTRPAQGLAKTHRRHLGAVQSSLRAIGSGAKRIVMPAARNKV